MSNQMLLQSDEMSELDTPKKRLKALLAALEGSVQLVIKAAAIFHVMKESGDDLSGVPSHLTKWLTKIHAKTVLPEVFIELGGVLRKRVSALPVQQQKNVVAGVPVKLYKPEAQRKKTVEIDPRKLSPEEVERVFDSNGSIRSVSQQRQHVKKLKTELKSVKYRNKWKLDQSRQGVVISDEFYSLKQLKTWIAKLES